MLGPPLLIGDRVAYCHDTGAYLNGSIKWMGRILPEFGQQMVVGVELVRNVGHIYTADQYYAFRRS
jgi:hypothetical protein